MNTVTRACAFGMVMLVAAVGAANAEMDAATAVSNCNAEAASTGLEDPADIKAYVDLCAQAWQSPAEYMEDAVEEIPEDVSADMPEDIPEDTLE